MVIRPGAAWVLLIASGIARSSTGTGVEPPGEPPAPSPPAGMSGAEEDLAELQRRAMELARVDPERLDSIERRLRLSALLPQLRTRLGRGTGQLQTVTDYAGNTRLAIGDHDAWQWDVGATWNLDRLIFHPDEVRLLREVQRAAAHRERLLREVAELFGERRRLLDALVRSPPLSQHDQEEARARVGELTVVLDALTGARGRRGRDGPDARPGNFRIPYGAHPPGAPGASGAGPSGAEEAE